jgi:HEAT repeat protein
MVTAATMSAMPKWLPAQVAQPSGQAGAVQGAAEARDEAAGRDIAEQAAILGDRAATAAKREEAARRLVSRSSPEADNVLLRALTDFNNRDGQIAVARALASDPTPQPMFVEPLLKQLGSGPVLTEAVAQALVTFKGNEEVRTTLVNYATNPTAPLEARAGVLAAMGKLVDKQAAGSLINFINSDENVRIRDAACDALAEITGLPRSSDVQGWNQWWEQNRAKSEEQWSKDLLRFNAGARTELAKRLQKMQDDARQVLLESYRAAANDADKSKLLNRYLQNDSEDIRLLGVQLVRDESANFRAVPPAVFEQLRKMVGDSAAGVRREVAVTLGTAGVGAVDALLTQLAQERDSSVRDAIVRALGPSHDLKAVDPLLSALNDTNFRVAWSAADSLSDMAGDLRDQKNAAVAAKVADALNRKMLATPPGPDNKELRTGLVGAAASLGHASSREILQRLASRQEPLERVRILALRGLGLIGNPASMLFINAALEDPSKLVQVEACKAMRTCADNFGGVANTLRPRIGKDTEPDPEVRSAAWETLSVLFKKAGESELKYWNQYLMKDPERRLRVQEEMESRYAEGGNEDRLAAIRQDMGAQYLMLNQPDKAAEKTQQALDYYDSRNANESVISPVVNQLMTAKLRTKKYGAAVDFAIDRLAHDPTTLTDMYRSVLDQINLLKAASDFTGALELITQFKRIDLKQYAPVVQRLEAEIKQLQSTGGRVYVRQQKAYEHVALFQFHVL